MAASGGYHRLLLQVPLAGIEPMNSDDRVIFFEHLLTVFRGTGRIMVASHTQ